ncbi:GGDEF domain-containing protein [Glaciecola petra]|uniref:diguanylate cyclase n=1 Tax=Glaciecola petra TaxID=3075602 RepID=A0ABU2ZS57_9ALTE|nr:GGDEF domain-containing protein [Aestuariibacter sp. P117]MDT0595091.1 GGDEF domain-containing protein [Aestuariibacter sp. P117]
MFRTQPAQNSTEFKSDFLIRSTFGVSLVSSLLLFPLCINSFIDGRNFDGAFGLFTCCLFVINAIACHRGRYFYWLNIVGVVPAFILGSANGLFSLGVMGSYWPALCLFGIYFILPFKVAKFVNVIFLIIIFAAAYHTLENEMFFRFIVSLTAVSFFIFLSMKEVTYSQNVLKKQAMTDPLTGALNRVDLPQSLQNAIDECKKYQTDATLCVLDIDHFKRINDEYGHDMGDKVLVDLSKHIQSLISSKDTLFRVGGEEFVILMRNTSLLEGKLTADALRDTIKSLNMLENKVITVSIGVTQLKPEYTWKQWMKQSDEKLYFAKEEGRDRIVA